MCNNATLEPKLVDFENSATSARLECDSLTDYKWWRSNSSSCELSSFTPYLDCTTQICRVPLATLMDDFYMYFCCTRATVSSLEGIQPPKCFQIQGELICYHKKYLIYILMCTTFTEVIANSSPPPPLFYSMSQDNWFCCATSHVCWITRKSLCYHPG